MRIHCRRKPARGGSDSLHFVLPVAMQRIGSPGPLPFFRGGPWRGPLLGGAPVIVLGTIVNSQDEWTVATG